MIIKSIKKLLPAIIGLSVIASLVFLFGRTPELGNSITSLKAPKEKILAHKTIKVKECIETEKSATSTKKIKCKTEKEKDIVKYDYISDRKVEDKFVWDDDPYTNVRISDKPDTLDFFVGDHFYKDETGVYEIEHGATATPEIFAQAMKPTLAERIKGLSTAQADELTPVYVGAGDGAALTNQYRSWDTNHDAAEADVVTPTNGDWNINAHYSAPNYQISRGFLPTDTSALPTGAVVSAATMTVVVKGSAGSPNAMLVGPTTQADPTTLAVTDYNECGATSTPTELSDTITISTATKTFTLNATGRGEIDDDGYTLLGVRNEVDVDDSPAGTTMWWQMYGSEATGTSNDPYLSITYEEAAPAEEPQGQVIWFN